MAITTGQVGILILTFLPIFAWSNPSPYQSEMDFLRSNSQKIELKLPTEVHEQLNAVSETSSATKRKSLPQDEELFSDSISTGQAGLKKRAATQQRSPFALSHEDQRLLDEIDLSNSKSKGSSIKRFRKRSR